MKADLTRFATVEDGVMTCALHGWQWELATGTCLTSEGHPLYARPDRRAGGDDADRRRRGRDRRDRRPDHERRRSPRAGRD